MAACSNNFTPFSNALCVVFGAEFSSFSVVGIPERHNQTAVSLIWSEPPVDHMSSQMVFLATRNGISSPSREGMTDNNLGVATRKTECHHRAGESTVTLFSDSMKV
ncbi:hypothetical protein FRB93_005242 [Tulasnella sp. JGI-2019a]|nr:hypothetical protein FRB93_005242 [Tulasnella sp. JGI-2019a]